MLEKMLDRYDEISYFVSHHEQKLANLNLEALHGLMLLSGSVYGIVVFAVFFFESNFQLQVEYFLPIGVYVLYYLGHRYLEEKMKETFDRTRSYCLLYYGLLTVSLSFVDSAMNPQKRGVVFVIAILLLSILYLDHFNIQFGFKILLFFVFFVISLVVKQQPYSGEDIRYGIVTVILGLFCDVIVLSTHAAQGTHSRIFEEKSQTDLLTGLYNKLSFEEKSKEYLKTRGEGVECSLFILDFDNFKHVNDNFGHQVGDEALKAFGRILQNDFRASDIVGRVGGDEFMVLVTGGMPDGYIKKRCDYVQHEINVLHIEQAAGFSCSIGVAVDASGVDFDTLYQAADAALYRAKKNGKARYEENRILSPGNYEEIPTDKVQGLVGIAKEKTSRDMEPETSAAEEKTDSNLSE